MVIASIVPAAGFLLAAAFAVGPVRAFAIDRFGRDEARAVWVPALAAMVLVGLLLPLGYALADLARGVLVRAAFESLFVLGFFTFYLGPAVAAAVVAGRRAVREPRVAFLAAGLGTGVYLALVYPLVNFLNSCFLGHGILLPAGC